MSAIAASRSNAAAPGSSVEAGATTTTSSMLHRYGPTMTLADVAPLVRYSEGTLRQYMKRTAYADLPIIQALKAARVDVTPLLFNTSKIAAFLDA